MDLLVTAGRTLGFSLAAGVNLYATVSMLGLALKLARDRNDALAASDPATWRAIWEISSSPNQTARRRISLRWSWTTRR